jgi:hypothetical protein
MATQVQWRGGSTAEHATFTGAAREVTVDTQKQTLVVHDGSTAGGEALLREDQANLPGSVTNGIYTPGTNQVAVATNGTGRLFVASDGKIGIGGTPSNPLDVFGSATLGIRYKGSGSYAGIVADNTSSTGGGYFGAYQNGTQKAIFGITGAIIGDTSADAGILAETSQGIRFFTNGSVTEKMRITDAGLVGIGTSAPGGNLDVRGVSGTPIISAQGTDNNGDADVRILSTGTTGTSRLFFSDTAGSLGSIIYRHANDSLAFGTNSLEAIRIDSSQRVGIGTTAPGSYEASANNLVVADSGNGGITIATGTSSYGSIYFADGTTAADTYRGVVEYNHSNNAMAFWTDATERARIDSSGRLLVGTSSARTNFYNTTYSSQFQVEGDASATAQISLTSTFAGINGPNLIFGKHRSGSSGGNTIVQNNDQIGTLAFMGSDGSEQVAGAYIEAFVDGTPGANDMPGRLTFSTTADGASSPTERMRIDSSGTHQLYGINDTLFSRTNRGAGTSYVIFAGVHSSTGPGTGTPSCFIYSNGNIQNTNNSYGAISDLKLKENIVDASSQWDDLKALQVRNYNFKEGQTHTQIGLVAQEAELVSPGLVSESPDRDAEGNDLGTVTKSVNYSVLYMKAVKALQEAMERIETLEAKVAALESA